MRFLVPFLLLTIAACAPKTARFTGPGHDFDWPIESPDAETYSAFLRAKRLSGEGDSDGAIAELRKILRTNPRSPYLLWSLAVEYTKKNDLPAAEASARAAVAADPTFRDAYALLGRIHTSRSEWDQAEAAYRRVIEIDGETSNEGSLALAGLYSESKRPELAEEILLEIIRKDPGDVLARYYLGRVYAEQNRMKDALSTYRSASSINPTFTAPLRAVAAIHQYLGETEAAVNAFEEILTVAPDDLEVRRQLGQIQLDRENFDAAEKEYEAVVAASPNDTTARVRLGLIYLRREKLEPADRLLSEVLRETPEATLVPYYLAIVRERRGKTSDAIRLLERSGSDAPLFSESCLTLASLHEKGGDSRKAEKVLRKALGERKESSDLRAGLAALLVRMKRIPEAIALLEEGLRGSPKDEVLWGALAEASDKGGDFNRTVECLRKVIGINPDNAGALNYLGYSFAEKGINLDEAEQLIGRAIEIRPKDGYIMDSLGWVYYQQGRFEKAVETLEAALKLSPDEPVILEHLGDAAAKAGNRKKAAEAYGKAIEFSKEEAAKERMGRKRAELANP